MQFMKLSRSELNDEFTREFLVACPSAVLEVIAKESRSQTDKLMQTIQDMEERIVELIKKQALGAPSEHNEPAPNN